MRGGEDIPELIHEKLDINIPELIHGGYFLSAPLGRERRGKRNPSTYVTYRKKIQP
jgi:hypothetical protein